MEKNIHELRELSNKEVELTEEARKLRARQIKLCRKELLGRCFRVKDRHGRAVKGEEYASYFCVTDIVGGKGWNKNFHLRCVVIDFDEIKDEEDWGVQMCYQSNIVTNWLDMIERAEEVSKEEFDDAKDRAFEYIGEKVDKVAEED